MTVRSLCRWALAWSFAALICGPLVAEEGPQPTQSLAAPVDARVQTEMQRQSIVGLAVACVQANRVAHIDTWGWADRENRVRVSPQTRFRWASISKPLTAVAAMQLWEQGQLDLDRDIRHYLPEFPEKRHPVSARQLLCHQGGIPHYANGLVMGRQRTYPTEHPFSDTVLAIDTFCNSPLLSKPGTAFSYTTYGYMLLGAVVQKAGAEPFAEQVRRRIAEPLGMTTLRPDVQWESIPHRAVGYKNALLGKARVVSGNSDVSWKLPGGGYISNVEDLAKFAIGLLSHCLLKPETRVAMWSLQRTADGKKTRYGLGFGVRNHKGHTVATHSGAQQKASSFLLIDPTNGSAVAILCNTEGVKLGKLAYDLLDLTNEAGAEQEAPRQSSELFQRRGRHYHMPSPKSAPGGQNR